MPNVRPESALSRFTFKPSRLRQSVLAVLLGVQCAVFAASFDDARTAANVGDASGLSRIIQSGIQADSRDDHGNSLLILAAREGQLASVEVLLKAGAALDYRNPAGDSALMLAVLGGHEAVAKRLIAAGAAVNHDGWTPLHYAAFEGRTALLEQLIAAGAEVNARAPNQATTLMLAARNGHAAVVRVLLKLKQTDLNALNDAGLSADAWALQNRNTDIAGLIAAERQRRGLPEPALQLIID